MKNYIQEKTRYLRAMMLTMLVGLFAFNGYAQTFNSVTVDAAPYFAGESETVTYNASGFDAGTAFILWNDINNNASIDTNEDVFGISAVQGADEDLDFTWPSINVRLRLAAFSGDTYLEDAETITIQSSEVTAVGTNDPGPSYSFDRASLRQATTTGYDLTSTAPTRLDLVITTGFSDVVNPIEVLFSTNGFTTFTVLEDINADTEFLGSNNYTFELPPAAKTANTSFRVRQKGTVDYGTGETWSFSSMAISIGDVYAFAQGSSLNQFSIISIPFIQINDAQDAANASAGTYYPGDEINLIAELQNVDLTAKSFVATVISDNGNGDEYLLEGQSFTKDNVTKEVTLTGTIPTAIGYDNFNNWQIVLGAYEGSAPRFGVNVFESFTAGLDASFIQEGGVQNGSGLVFDQASERSLLAPALNLTSTDGIVTFDIARKNNVVSPAGTDIIVEFTTDGTTYTELTSFSVNDVPFQGNGFATVEYDTWPTGVVNANTQFRFRQEGNNGANLDAWVLKNLSLINDSNIIPNGTIDEGIFFVSLLSPEITVNTIDVGGDGLAYPMEDYSFTYTIEEGAFPAGTAATIYFDRDGGGFNPDFDLIVGSAADVTAGTASFTVPPIEAGDYTLYMVANAQVYGQANLAVYDLELTINNITFENTVSIAGEDFGSPGSGITVEYSVLGTQGASAELMLSVFDDNIGEYVMIGASNTINGTITATLPSTIDYGNNPALQLTLGNGGVYSTSPFDETVFDEYWYFQPIPDEIKESTVGLSNNLIPDGFDGAGERSFTSVPFDFTPYGGAIRVQLYSIGNFIGNFDVSIEGSNDGENWEELDVASFSFFNQVVNRTFEIPNTYWTDSFQYRIIYNEDGAFSDGDNAITFYASRVYEPLFLESTAVFANFNISRPSLSVSDYDKTSFAIGEEVVINYNALGFEAGVEFAAVVIQSNEYYIAGTSATQGAGTITATMPFVLPIDVNDPLAQYDLEIIPYIPETAGDPIRFGERVVVDLESDFLVIDGDRFPTNYSRFYMDRAGDREILTRAFDLSGAESVILSFQYNDSFGNIAANANKNTVPRLQVSIDGGATFQEIMVEDLAPGEMAMYDEGLLYEEDFYSVEIPAEFITAATHFRWYQPLNLGQDENAWEVEDIEVVNYRGNDVAAYVYQTTNNPVFNISLNAPDLADYLWVQSDLNDAVFNGESFDFSWDLQDGLTAADVDAFPAGTTFDFYLFEGGDYVINPETGLPYIVASVSALGIASGSVPFYVVNDNYDVRLAASLMVGGEKYYFIGDEESGSSVGELDLFLRVAQLEYLGDPNATIYAGQDVTFAITLENDETNLDANATIFANIIYDDVLVAAQQGLGNITFALPTDAVGNLDFDLELSEGAPIGEVGEELMNSDYNDLDDDQDNFTSQLNSLVEYSTNTFFESQLGYNPNAVIRFSMDFDNQTGQRVVMQYSIGSDPFVNAAFFSGNVNNTGYFLPSQMRNGSAVNDNIQYRWKLENDDADGNTFQITEVRIVDNNTGGTLRNPGFFISSNDIAVAFGGESGRRLITTRDFTADELADAEYLSFNVDFDQLPEDLTTAQYVKFEFSTDAGATYTELDSYPEMDADLTLSGDMFNYSLTDAMKAGVRFRWRQEEAKGDFEVYNIDINFGESIPFDYFNTDIDVVRQSLLLTSLSATEGCLDGDLTVAYEIRGRFGADNIVEVIYKDQNNNTSLIDGYEFNITEGTGDLIFAMPSDALDAGDDNESFRFRLSAYDETTDNDFTVNGPYSEESFELVAPILTDAEFGFNTPLACESEDVIVELFDEQDYFTYEVINTADGTVLGTLIYDPETGDDEINIGAITAFTSLGLRVTAMTQSGTVCNTLTSTYEDDVEVQEMHMLYSNNGGANDFFRLATAGEAVTVCNNNGDDILSVQRLLADGSITTGGTTSVEWFRDNVNNPVTTGSFLEDSDVTESGAYFARVTTGSCVYTTESVTVTTVDTPTKPTIALTSGNLVDCSTADPVVLTAPAGFTYYLWNTGETTQSISVDDTRQVTLRVSNAPFGGGCGSASSAPVQIDRNELPDFGVRNINTNEFIGASEVIDICEGFTVRFYDSNSWTNDGNITVVKDGADFATVESGDRDFFIEESGVYSFVWNFDNLNVTCSIESNEFTVNIFEQPTASPALSADGELTFCEGLGSVTLTAPEGFDYYRWRKGGTIFTNPTQGLANSNVLEVINAGVYTVEVGNAAGCYSPESNAITVTSVSEPAFDSFFQVETGCGSGTIDFNVRNRTGVATVFQLINGETGLASGSPITLTTINESGTITSGVVEEDGTPFYLELTYADGTGCVFSNADAFVNANVRNVVLEVEGARLSAKYGTSNFREIRWYRSGVLLSNANSSSILISDAAEYSVEVEYNNGCVVTASSADLGRVLSNRTGASMEVSTYPNPTADDLTVSIASEYMGLHTVIITTLTGQVMKNQSFEKSSFESKYEISITDLNSGMYNMQIQHNGLVKNVRIIKN